MEQGETAKTLSDGITKQVNQFVICLLRDGDKGMPITDCLQLIGGMTSGKKTEKKSNVNHFRKGDLFSFVNVRF